MFPRVSDPRGAWGHWLPKTLSPLLSKGWGDSPGCRGKCQSQLPWPAMCWCHSRLLPDSGTWWGKAQSVYCVNEEYYVTSATMPRPPNGHRSYFQFPFETICVHLCAERRSSARTHACTHAHKSFSRKGALVDFVIIQYTNISLRIFIF